MRRPTQGFKPKRSLEVMMFTSEEPTRFALSCIGSRAMSGALSADVLEAKRDVNGTTFMEVRLCDHGCMHRVLCVLQGQHTQCAR